jgi:hypothetical protein
MNTIIYLLDVILFVFIIVLLVEFVNKALGEESKVIDFIISLIKKVYGSIRQCFCKKGSESNADRGTVQNNADVYDSSSVWED